MSYYDDIELGLTDTANKPDEGHEFSRLYDNLDVDTDLTSRSTVVVKEPLHYSERGTSSALQFRPTRTKKRTDVSRVPKKRANHDAEVAAIKYFNPADAFKLNSYSDSSDYDPHLPNAYGEYVDTGGRVLEERDWKAYLLSVESESPGDNPGLELDAESASDETFEVGDDTSPLKSKKSFSFELLQRYGWKPGFGLGPSGGGLRTPLKVRVDKKRPGYGRVITQQPGKLRVRNQC